FSMAISYPLSGIDSRSIFPHWYSDPGTDRKRWDMQQQFRGPYPWQELTEEPNDEAKREREERDKWNAVRQVRGDGWEWRSDGTVHPIVRQDEPAPKPQPEPEPTPTRAIEPPELEATAFHEVCHEFLARLTGCTDVISTVEPSRSETGGLIYG